MIGMYVRALRGTASQMAFIAALLGGVGAGTAYAGPTPAIQTIATDGMAPFTVHVHALNSTLSVGNENTARYEWTFGDASAPYNTLVGWNAAHTYNSPGTYTVTLKITDQNGAFASTTKQITVSADTRSAIYVSPSGNDSNPGTQSAPIQSFGRAAQMLANNRKILFQRGGTFNTSSGMYVSQQNMLIGAYGSGNPPVFNYTSSASYTKIIDFDASAKDIIVENVRFDSNFTPDNVIVRGLQPHGTNITVRNCYFNKVSYAMNTGGGGVNGFLTQSNQADAIGAYFTWAEGSNHTYLGNNVINSVDEHNIRLGGVSRILIAYNDLSNDAKSTIWCMLGDHIYVANNTLRRGRFLAGPNFAVSSPGERTTWLVFEGNQIIDEGIIVYSGAEDMTFRNNIITDNGGECFSIWGYYAQWDRTCKNITIVNNTGLNNSNQYGKFLKLGNGAQNITVANNLYRATALNQPTGAGNVINDSPSLNTQSFHHNLWANPANGSYVHSVSGASKTASQWSAMGPNNELYRNFTTADLNAQFVPMFNASIGAAIPGVMRDFYGNPRPASSVAVGAVETGSAPPSPQPDVDGNGVVNVHDLLMVIASWGSCSNCAADVNHDGSVNIEDLIAVMNSWD